MKLHFAIMFKHTFLRCFPDTLTVPLFIYLWTYFTSRHDTLTKIWQVPSASRLTCTKIPQARYSPIRSCTDYKQISSMLFSLETPITPTPERDP